MKEPALMFLKKFKKIENWEKTMISNTIIKEFETISGKDGVMTSEVDRQNYSYDAAVLDPVVPAAVIRPGSGEEIGKIVALCNDNDIPVTVRGAGTNLSGGTIPMKNGIVLLTNRMNRIIELNETDMYVRVEPGVVTANLAAADRAGQQVRVTGSDQHARCARHRAGGCVEHGSDRLAGCDAEGDVAQHR